MPYKDLKSKQAKESQKQRRKRWAELLTNEVLVHYGGNPPQCACCGETQIKFLTIDHIDGRGNQHRKYLFGHPKQAGVIFYLWLRRNNFPKGYQVLCFNCNCGKNRNSGVCPHADSRNNNES